MTPATNNAKNDRVKRDYLIWLKEAKQRSQATVEQARHAIDRLEAYTAFKDFRTFNRDQALGFKRHLRDLKAERSGEPISLASVNHILSAARDFLRWLGGQPGFRRRILVSDIAYLNLTTGEERQARTSEPRPYASLTDYRAAIHAMPVETETERRDRALMALLVLTAMRDAAVTTLKVRHLNLDRRRVFQDPRDVKTKNSKLIETFFFPVGDDLIAIIREWVSYLIDQKQFGPDDPIFPKTAVGQDASHAFQAVGLSREHWANAQPVRQIFREAFARIGRPYVHPHSIRQTLTQFAFALELPPEHFKAWSQNMGHEKPLTTFNSYSHISSERQSQILAELRSGKPHSAVSEAVLDRLADKVAAKMAALRGE